MEIDPPSERRTNPASMEFFMQPIRRYGFASPCCFVVVLDLIALPKICASSRTLLEEVNENNIQTSPLQNPVMTQPAFELPTTAASSADTQIYAAQPAPEAGSGDKSLKLQKTS